VVLGAHLKFIHDFADGFAPGTNDAGMDTVVQWDILRNHLLKLTHDFQDSITGSFCVLLVPCDGDLVLGLKKENAVKEEGRPYWDPHDKCVLTQQGWSKRTT
jgi:hypothetical protein